MREFIKIILFALGCTFLIIAFIAFALNLTGSYYNLPERITLNVAALFFMITGTQLLYLACRNIIHITEKQHLKILIYINAPLFALGLVGILSAIVFSIFNLNTPSGLSLWSIYSLGISLIVSQYVLKKDKIQKIQNKIKQMKRKIKQLKNEQD